MRVALVSPGFPPDPGGVETVVGHLGTEFARMGHSTRVLCHRLPGTPARGDRVGQPELLDVERFGDWAHSRRFSVSPPLWRRIRQLSRQFEVVHAHSFHASPALAASVWTDAPQIFSPHFHELGHTPAARMLHKLYDPMARRIFSTAAAVICSSEAEAALVDGFYANVSAKLHVIPNGVDTETLLDATPMAIDRPVVFAAGRLEEYKQVDRLVRSVPSLPEDVLVVIAGDGPELPRLRRSAMDLGVGDRVRFLGHVPRAELQRWQRAAAVVVSLSRHEAFGLILLEGAVVGAALVATDLPAHRELSALLGVPMGWLPPAPEPTDVARAVIEALSSRPGLLPEKLIDSLSWQANAARTMALYEQVAA
jgi:glycosyltransferase involved in cell wall biosynthesis